MMRARSISRGSAMATKPATGNAAPSTDPSKEHSPSEAAKTPPTGARKIPGNLPYLTASGTLKRAMERLIEASRPDKFNADFMENVLKLTGGAARGTIPILKRMGFLTSDGTPTELYARFRTEGGRGAAALAGLKTGFPEIFKRSEYAHSVGDAKLRDIIVEITGLKPNDGIVQAIKGTFNAVKTFIPANWDTSSSEQDPNIDEFASTTPTAQASPVPGRSTPAGPGLVYNINIVLPETSDLRVLSAIFRSLKENLM
jgi:hypothetical protein